MRPAAYGLAAAQDPDNLPLRPLGQWNAFEIQVQGQAYRVALNGVPITQFDNPDANRGLAGTAEAPSFVGLQAHTGRVSFRNIRVTSL